MTLEPPPSHEDDATPDARGTLFVVATPIGNRDDLSARARQVLAEVDLVAAEDTRRTGRLLSHFGIDTRLMSLHEHNERASSAAVLRRLEKGASVALVSDAGTPLVSDPGYRLVSLAHEKGIRVSPIPGASAAAAALSVAGLPTNAWCFDGFLPARPTARRERLAALARETRTLVFYETPHRIAAALEDLAAAFGASRPAFVGRELSKVHEQCRHATLGELAAMVRDGRIPAKGEFVVVVGGADTAKADGGTIDAERLLQELVRVLPGRQAVEIVATVSGRPKNDLYRRMLEITVGRGD
jgi:16S rRNA (cytidine1402-2'-O)-methyltransferase